MSGNEWFLLFLGVAAPIGYFFSNSLQKRTVEKRQTLMCYLKLIFVLLFLYSIINIFVDFWIDSHLLFAVFIILIILLLGFAYSDDLMDEIEEKALEASEKETKKIRGQLSNGRINTDP